MESIYSATDYKRYLIALMTSYPNAGRGLRKQLSSFIGCQVAYITQVLSGSSHFSAEQGEAAARFFQLAPKETEFFLLLIAQNRAGTKPLQALFSELLRKQRAEAKQLKNRLAIKPTSKSSYHDIYYSSWHYAAVHMALLCKDLQTAAKISQRLKIPVPKVNAVLAFLVEQQLANHNSGEYAATENSMHLPRSSPFIGRHHANWRLRAIQALDENLTEATHYSGVISCSRADLEKVQEKLSQCLEECIAIIRESPSEEIAVLNLDLFSLGN